jgi:hypothetical protein
MKQRNWLVFVLLAWGLLVAACARGASPTPTLEEQTQPTTALNVPAKTQAAAPTKTPVPSATPTAVEAGSIIPADFAKSMDRYILRPDDLQVAYKIPPGGEKRISNAGVIQERGEVEGKRYIIATRRVDGWYIQMERRRKEDIAPAAYESRLELFETQSGARLALSPEWFPPLKDEENPPTFVEGGCDLGQGCLFYYYQRLDKATNLTYLQYHVAFTYRNVLVWVMGRGLDFDVDPQTVLATARIALNKLENAPIASR